MINFDVQLNLSIKVYTHFTKRIPKDEVEAKPLSRKERRKIQQQQKLRECGLQNPRARRWPSALLSSFISILGVVGTLLALVALYPEFSVSREPPLDPTNPLTALFVLRYETILPVDDVDVSCFLNKVRGVHNNGIENIGIGASKIHVGQMWQGDEVTIPCVPPGALKVEGGVASGDIVLRIRFHTIVRRWLHYKLSQLSERDFRYVTAKQADGNLVWFPETKEFHSNGDGAFITTDRPKGW